MYSEHQISARSVVPCKVLRPFHHVSREIHKQLNIMKEYSSLGVHRRE